MTVMEAGFFDRKRTLRVPSGRPKFPNWQALLAIGPVIVASGDYPFIEDAEADGYSFPTAGRRPALFDGALVAEWLDLEEGAACTALRHAWHSLRSPACKYEALAMLSGWNDRDCIELYGRHRLGHAQASRFTLGYEPVEAGEWAVACCRDCRRPLLWHRAVLDGACRTWPFFDMRWTRRSP